jgi:hypothetical protein
MVQVAPELRRHAADSLAAYDDAKHLEALR